MNPTWQPNQSIAENQIIVDPNGNIQQATQGGQTGLSTPAFANINLGSATPDNTVEWVLVAVLNTKPQLPGTLGALPEPDFIGDADGRDPNLVLQDMVSLFEATSGRTLYPAQPERLLINDYAYRESLVRDAIEYAGKQNLVAFASYPMLDFLGQFIGVSRLDAQSALTTLQITLAEALDVSFTLNAGWQVATTDGLFTFITLQDVTFEPGQLIASVSASCISPGADANGYLPGTITIPITGNALISSVSNTATSSGGSEPETDDELRTRIQLAPNRFSNAGPIGAYQFFALGVDPAIIDVQVISPAPGKVSVFVLTGPIVNQPAATPNSTGIASQALLDQVTAQLNSDTIRPLTDTVTVFSVTEIDYVIDATVTLYADADPSTVENAVNAAAQGLALALASRIQRSVILSAIIAALKVPGVYDVALISPSSSNILTAGQWANCTAINLVFNATTEKSV